MKRRLHSGEGDVPAKRRVAPGGKTPKVPLPKSVDDDLQKLSSAVRRAGTASGGAAATATPNTKVPERPVSRHKKEGPVWRRHVYQPAKTVYEGYMVVNAHGKPQREGHGIYIDKCRNRYEGGWKNDRAQGYGTKIFSKGDRHEGLYKDDKRNGWGKYVWANGDKYIGLWHQGMMHGRGTFMWSKGDTYEGEWRTGKMHGQGRKQMANGDMYEGRWQNGMADGWGKKIFSCKDMHEGYYKEDKRCGFGLYSWLKRSSEHL